MKVSKSERERERERDNARACVRVTKGRKEKKSRPERKDYIGDFGFRVSSGRKADFPDFAVFRATRAATRIRRPLCEHGYESKRGRSCYPPPPAS